MSGQDQHSAVQETAENGQANSPGRQSGVDCTGVHTSSHTAIYGAGTIHKGRFARVGEKFSWWEEKLSQIIDGVRNKGRV